MSGLPGQPAVEHGHKVTVLEGVTPENIEVSFIQGKFHIQCAAFLISA
jgi:hypothetical protein